MEQAEISGVLTPSILLLNQALANSRRTILAPGAVVRGEMYSVESGEPMAGDPHEQLCRAIMTIDSSEHSENGSVLRFPGVFEVDAEVVRSIAALNEAKDNLRACVTWLKGAGVTQRNMRAAYRIAGASRIHPLQAWRHIPLLDGNITSIGFTQSKKARAVETMSRDEAARRLYCRGADDIAEMIGALPEDALVKWSIPVLPHIKANVVWGTGAEAVRKLIYAGSPLLVPRGRWPSKRVIFNAGSERQNRSDRGVGTLIDLPFRDGAYLFISAISA